MGSSSHDAPPKGPDRRGPTVVAVVIAVTLILVVSSLAFRFGSSSQVSAQPVADGPTFYQVLASLNSTTRNVSGGPWSLVSVIGIASPAPFSPNVEGYLRLNVSVNACQLQFQGLTLWNGSLPLFTGTFNSGTAPFWQFAYYSEASQDLLVATSVDGAPQVYAPIPITNNCTYAWTTLRSDPSAWVNQIYANGSLPVNSPVAAQVALTNIDQTWIEESAPLAEVYALGPAMFTGTGDVSGGNWEVYFMGCGVAGYTGVRPVYAAGVSRDGIWGGALNLSRNCVTLSSTGPVVDRGINQFFFSPPLVTNATTSTWVGIPYQIGITATNGSFYGYYDGWGVADWMTSINLTTASGQRLTPATSGCPDWVPSMSDCKANSSGWFVVLLSAGGEWLASYGATGQGGAGWTVPVTAMVSHQSIEVVVPSAWSVQGDHLTLSSRVSVCVITGNRSL
jgi:hypothetical protein